MTKSVKEYTFTDGTMSIRFDYATVDVEHHEALRQNASEIQSRLKDTAMMMLEIGQRLVHARALLPHGAWLPWLTSETGMSESWSRNCIKVYDRFHEHLNVLRQFDVVLPPTAIVRLATAPDNAIEDVMDRLVEGGTWRVADVDALIKRHRNGENEPANAVEETEPAEDAGPLGVDALRIMADRAREELVPLVIERMQEVLTFLEDTDDRYRAGNRIGLKELQANLRERAQWLTDALEQITQRRAASDAKLVHMTFLDRPEHEPGPWADAAAFLRDLSASSAWEKIKAADVPDLLRRGREVLQAVLPPVPRSFFRYPAAGGR